MPALAETQYPIFLRDKNCGVLPEQNQGETITEYYHRLSLIYFIPVEVIEKFFASPS